MTLDDVRVTRLLLAHRKEIGWTLESRPDDFEQDWASPDAVGPGWNVVLGRRGGRRPLSVSHPGGGNVLVLQELTSAQQVADCLAAVGLVPVELTSGWRAGYEAGAAVESDRYLDGYNAGYEYAGGAS